MANIIKPKRSTVAAKVPTTSDLVTGEIGVNMTDQKIYINNGGTITQIGAGTLSSIGGVSISSPTNNQVLKYNGTNWINDTVGGGGSGDVTGPASSTDNALSRFDGTTGKTIQNSTVTLNDDGNFDNVNGITFDTTPTNAPTAVGSMFWDSGDGTPSVILDNDVSLQLGQENVALVYNGTGATISKGKVVAVSGAQGQRPSVVLADADSEPYSAATLGIATEDIANGAQGFICTFGLVRGIDTSGFTAGNPIWLSQTPGEFTTTKPSAPAHLVFLGWVIKVNASSGEVFVHISNGWELDELHNVLITSPQSGNTLIYDATAGVWKNSNLTDGTGISITEGAGSITVNLASGYGDTLNPYASKTANYVLASPNGTSGVPTFRALVPEDVPTLNQNTTGTASNVTGTVAIANGGTGQTTSSAAFNALSPITNTGDIIIGNGTNSATRLGIGANGTVLGSDGTTASWVSFTSGAALSNDTSTASNLYPLFANATTGTPSTIYTSNAKLLYKPSTGELQASELVASNGLILNSTTVSTSYTIGTGTNAMSVGPITVASGQSVTVSSGQRWVVI